MGEAKVSSGISMNISTNFNFLRENKGKIRIKCSFSDSVK